MTYLVFLPQKTKPEVDGISPEQLIWFSSFLRLLLFIILQCQDLMSAGKHPTIEGSQKNSFFSGNLNLNENPKMIAVKPLR